MSSDYNDLKPPPTLSPVERQILLLQHQILANLDTGEGDYHKRMVEVLTEGFTSEYEYLFTPYAELPKDDCKLVVDILDMFRVMKASLKELPEPERNELTGNHKYTVTFRGFDGNDAREGKMASYVTFLQKNDGWTDLREDVDAADRGNSHARLLGLYQAMLDVYRPIWNEVMRGGGLHLSAEQLRRVAEARP